MNSSANLVSPVLKRPIALNGRKTSVSLENEFWEALKEIAKLNEVSTSELILVIDRSRCSANLSSALRLHVLEYYRARRDPSKP